MSMFSKYRIFQKFVVLIFVTFMGMLVLVTVVTYRRPSGSTRQDMAEAQFIRKKAAEIQSEQDKLTSFADP